MSHDQYLVQQVAGRVYLVAGGAVRLLEEGMPQYVAMLAGTSHAKRV